MKPINLFLFSAFISLVYSASAQNVKSVKLISDVQVTSEGLYFTGEKKKDFIFGRRITPHGDCIDVISGYVFVTWYKGGMDKRNLMLSRKKVDSDTWQTIEFPYPHVGFRGNPKVGDSHNRAAIRICPIDETVHVVFDLHGYMKEELPDRYFSYIVSKPNMAFAEEWTIDNFNTLRTYLREDENYERMTYPEFNRFDDGRIMVDFRNRGSGNGNDLFSFYDGKGWSKMFQYNNGNQPNKMNYNFYGSFKFMHGKLYQGGSIRYGLANSDDNFKYDGNNGLFLAYADAPFGNSDWKDIKGNSIKIPLQNPDVIKVAEPCDINPEKNNVKQPFWTVSISGDVHYLTSVGDKNVHFYKNADKNEFLYSTDCPPPGGDILAIGNTILVVTLENGRPLMKSTPAGENSWNTLLKETRGDSYHHCNVIFEGNKIFLYAMKKGTGDAQPITLLTYEVKW